ncbi:hypothetical protein H4R18_005843 [Coemansia javaensis]|uniref:Uncharacterized protein n=1 Tax=Coemansia javaensis TaxID=2761396 RepID=A0A9W8H7W1_9FUNG|nr:hypothetical protein H4R18_005843 [Coemansia javaensis]
MEIDVDTMVEFIRCLPRLSSLGIMSLNPHSTRLDISVPEPGAGRLVEPISNMLKSVSIAFRCNDQNHTNPAVLALKYLLLAVPSLSSISAHGIPDDSMDGFIDAYADQYLHLARLRIHIYERRRWG